MARRQLLTDEERLALLGIPPDAESLARLFTLSRSDRDLVAERRGDANCLGCAVQLALLRHPGTALAYFDQPPDALVTWMAGQLDIPAAAFAEYARRPQTMTDHARQLAATLGLRPPTMADLPPMIEAAAEAARGTDRGQPIAAAVAAALRTARIILPGAAVIERIAIAGRARARKRAADAPVAGLSAEQLTKLDGLLVVDASSKASWATKAACTGCSRSPSARPSMVVTSSPSRASCSVASARQALMRRPLTSTVQAPHWPWPQPFLVPARWRPLRRQSSKVRRGSAASQGLRMKSRVGFA